MPRLRNLSEHARPIILGSFTNNEKLEAKKNFKKGHGFTSYLRIALNRSDSHKVLYNATDQQICGRGIKGLFFGDGADY